MRTAKRAVGRVLTGAAGVFAIVAISTSGAAAQKLSEKAVKTFMSYAWALTPEKFTTPKGKTIMIDKSKKDKVLVPVDNARDVIMAGRLTAHAQICELPKAKVANFNSLMRREQASKKWSPQQMIYINQLHLTTVMLLTGQIKLVEKKEGGKEVVVYEEKKSAKTCTDEQRKKVNELIKAYLKSEPRTKAGANKQG
ncbi:MAG: hypothetical protein AAFO62_10100 [Pseudomonadota bacterium]